jgi:hypothetical protein
MMLPFLALLSNCVLEAAAADQTVMANSTNFYDIMRFVNENAGKYDSVTIIVAAGNYSEAQCNAQLDCGQTHPLQSVTIQGDGKGKATFACGSKSKSFMRIIGTLGQKMAVDFKFTEGSELVITGGVDSSSGGGITVTTADVTLEYCIFKGNRAGVYGGAISLDKSATAKLTHCILSENTANQAGGVAFVNTGSSIEFDSSIVDGNSVDSLKAKGGGVICIKNLDGSSSPSATFKNTKITNNNAGDENHGGGVIYFMDAGASASFEDCTITGNSAGLDSDGGGVVYFNVNVKNSSTTQSSKVTFLRSKVSKNTVVTSSVAGGVKTAPTAPQGGGVVYMMRGTGVVLFQDSVVTGNVANTSWGGGVAFIGAPADTDKNAVGSIEFAGTTSVSSNEAQFGAVVLTMHKDVRIKYGPKATITSNIARKNGGVMAMMGANDPSTVMNDFNSMMLDDNNAVAVNGGDIFWWAYPSSCFSKKDRDGLLLKISRTPSGSKYDATSAFSSGPLTIDCDVIAGKKVPAGEEFDSTWVLRDCYGTDVSVLNGQGTFVFDFNSSDGCVASPSSWKWENKHGGTVVKGTSLVRQSKDSDCALTVTLEPQTSSSQSSPPLAKLTGFRTSETFRIAPEDFTCAQKGFSKDSHGNCEEKAATIGLFVALAVLGAVVVVMFFVSVRVYLKRRHKRRREEYTNFDVELRSSFLNSSTGGYTLNEQGGESKRESLSMFGRLRSPSLTGRTRSSSAPGPNERPAWEVPFKKLQFQKQIGGGASGQVFHGRYSNMDVAIKQIILGAKEKSLELDLKAVKEEARILWTLRHPQVTMFYGVSLAVRNNMNTLFFVTELCLGSLDCYLEGNRPHGHEHEEEEEEDENDFVMRSRGNSSVIEPSLPALTRKLYYKFIRQMAEGMAFMHSKGTIVAMLSSALAHCSLCRRHAPRPQAAQSARLNRDEPQDMRLRYVQTACREVRHLNPSHCVLNTPKACLLHLRRKRGKASAAHTANIGSPSYMAPELVSMDGPQSEYSFGIDVYA